MHATTMMAHTEGDQCVSPGRKSAEKSVATIAPRYTSAVPKRVGEMWRPSDAVRADAAAARRVALTP